MLGIGFAPCRRSVLHRDFGFFRLLSRILEHCACDGGEHHFSAPAKSDENGAPMFDQIVQNQLSDKRYHTSDISNSGKWHIKVYLVHNRPC